MTILCLSKLFTPWSFCVQNSSGHTDPTLRCYLHVLPPTVFIAFGLLFRWMLWV